MSQIANVVPAQSYDAIVGKAEALRAMLSNYGVKLHEPFPIVDVLELVIPTLMPEYYFGVASASELGPVEAIKTKDDHIMVREDVYEAALAGQPRARFTLAHELGHLVLHPQPVLTRLTVPPNTKLKSYYNPEWQANAYAGALLIPRAGVVGLGVREVAAKYQVSLQATGIRMEKIMNGKS